jgi:hypothetical protein
LPRRTRRIPWRCEQPDATTGGVASAAQAKRARAEVLFPISGRRTGGALPPATGPCGSVRVAEYSLERRAHGRHQQRFGSAGAVLPSGGLPLNQGDEQHPTAHDPAGEGQPKDRARQTARQGLFGRAGCPANRQRDRNLTPPESARRPQLLRRLRLALRGQAIPPGRPSSLRTGPPHRSTSSILPAKPPTTRSYRN